jgi:hypothetical protein
VNRNSCFAAFSVPFKGATADHSWLSDGDRNATNDWTSAFGANSVQWNGREKSALNQESLRTHAMSFSSAELSGSKHSKKHGRTRNNHRARFTNTQASRKI